MEPKCGLQANDAVGYARAREHYLPLKACGEIFTGTKPPPDLSKGVHAAGLCLVLLDVFQTDTDPFARTTVRLSTIKSKRFFIDTRTFVTLAMART
jgi:hypothetical protein